MCTAKANKQTNKQTNKRNSEQNTRKKTAWSHNQSRFISYDKINWL